jgi:hypothetical protein
MAVRPFPFLKKHFTRREKMNSLMKTALTGITIGAMATTSVWAQGAGRGLVGTNCKVEIAKYCANISHGSQAIPVCLKKYKSKLSASCKKALANKGPGRGLGQGMGRNRRNLNR